MPVGTTSAIGRALETRTQISAAAIAGLGAITIDFLLSHGALWVSAAEPAAPTVPAVTTVVFLFWLAGGDRKS